MRSSQWEIAEMRQDVKAFFMGAGVVIWLVIAVFFSTGSRLSQDVKSGICHTGKTELYQPPDLIVRGAPYTPKPYPRQEVICPETKHWRDPK